MLTAHLKLNSYNEKLLKLEGSVKIMGGFGEREVTTVSKVPKVVYCSYYACLITVILILK
jgi:hypothetical protein